MRSEEYYDDFFKRERANTWWRIAVRYAVSVIMFLLLILISLTGYWLWQDYGSRGLQAVTWESLVHRAEYRWQRFLSGELDFDCSQC